MSNRLRRARTAIRLAGGRLGSPASASDKEALTEARATGAPPDLESRLVWILGSPRTGSSWLLRMLIHPAILASQASAGMRRAVGERRRPLSDLVPIDESYVMSHVAPMRLRPFTGKQPPPDELTLNAARRNEAGYFFADEYADVWRPALRDLILARFAAHARRAEAQFGFSKPLVVIKEPNGSHAAELLLSLLPSSRLIFLLRDGRDVVDSLVASRQERGWRQAISNEDVTSEASRLAYVRRESQVWVNRTTAVQSAYAAHGPGRRYRLRYEDLLDQTQSELGRLLEWLGRPRADDELSDTVAVHAFESLPKFLTGPGKIRRAATPGLWRENLTAAEQDVMSEVMGAKLRELGYED